MIGYYVHHQGRGHVHRATAFARAWRARTGEEVTALSSLPVPSGWRGPWVELDRDDDGEVRDPTARGSLHWAPLGVAGLRDRTATVSRWIAAERPRAVVVDVSIEMVLLVRLHGVPVVTVLQPGRRDDNAHLTGLRVADAIVCPWPAAAEVGDARMLPGLPRDVDARAVRVGAVSRFDPVDATVGSARGQGAAPRVAVLEGTGGPGVLTRAARRVLGPPASPATHDPARDGGTTSDGKRSWSWRSMAQGVTWSDDPLPLLASSDVVVTHAGGGALADVAAARVPAVVVAGQRPHDEQRVAASVLAAGPWPVLVRDRAEDALAPETLDAARRLDGRSWSGWVDGSAERFAAVVASVALPGEPGPGSGG